MKFVLSGGGDYGDSKKIDDIYKGMLNGKRILYIPRAMYPDMYESCYTWIQNIFPVQEGYSVHLLSELEFSEKQQNYSDLYDGVYLGGGNTFRLLKCIREMGFSKIIEDFLAHDKPIYGGSAGAIIMGKDIHTAEDRNIVGLTVEECLGFNVCNKYSLSCHYSGSSSFDNEIFDYIQHYQTPVIVLPEGTGLIYDNGEYCIQGKKSAYKLDISLNKIELVPGTKIIK